MSISRWEVLEETLPVVGALYGAQQARTIAVGLGDRGLVVVSPGVPIVEAGFVDLARFGTPRFLLAPNSLHNAGLATWSARYPDAVVVAHPRAIRRLHKQVPSVRVEDLARLEAALPPSVRLFSPPMTKQGETWLSLALPHHRAWFVVDGILNLERLPPGPLGWVLRLLGFRAGLFANRFFQRRFVTDRAALRAWILAALDRDRPTMLIPAHGEILVGDDVTDRLRAVVEAGVR